MHSKCALIQKIKRLYVDRTAGGTANFFQGNIAGVVIYNYALTPDQVAAHHEVGLTGTTNTAGPTCRM